MCELYLIEMKNNDKSILREGGEWRTSVTALHKQHLRVERATYRCSLEWRHHEACSLPVHSYDR